MAARAVEAVPALVHGLVQSGSPAWVSRRSASFGQGSLADDRIGTKLEVQPAEVSCPRSRPVWRSHSNRRRSEARDTRNLRWTLMPPHEPATSAGPGPGERILADRCAPRPAKVPVFRSTSSLSGSNISPFRPNSSCREEAPDGNQLQDDGPHPEDRSRRREALRWAPREREAGRSREGQREETGRSPLRRSALGRQKAKGIMTRPPV